MDGVAKRTPFIMLDMSDCDRPLYRQIYDSIRFSILNGEFQSGMRLPASRALAEQLGISRMTVINAYEQLLAEGYLEGRAGSGTFVASRLPEEFLHTPIVNGAANTGTRIPRNLQLSNYGHHLNDNEQKIIGNHSATVAVPFQHSLTAIDEFPFDIWSKIAQKHLKYSYRHLGGYNDPAGFRPLRRAIASHLRATRGVQCEEEQVIITGGTQQAVYLIGRILLSPANTVWVEDPGHLSAIDVFDASGATVVRIPVDDEGFDFNRAIDVKSKAKLIYVTPSRQFPLGLTMSLQRRLNLLEWASENDAWIIEDDYDSEFRYSGRPLASLQGLDRHGRVLYVGTFSKTVFPGLRLGCVVVPADLVDVFTAARALTDLHGPVTDQMILADFISEGHFERHVRRMRTLYRERQHILIHEIKRQIGDVLEVPAADAGMHAIGWLPQGVCDQTVSEKALEHGLRVAPVSRYAANKMDRGGLMLGYTAFNERQIKAGVKTLTKVLSESI
jgi:GntR family transcriptional regulator/MocR family aminotransferase